MKKLLFAILVILVLPSYLWAVNYFACNGSVSLTSNNWCTAGAAGLGNCAGTPDTTYAVANNAANTLYANGCTLDIPNGTALVAGKISTKDGDAGGAAVAGGSFNATTNGMSATVDSSVEGGTTDCLTVGSGANTITFNLLTTNGGGTITTDATAGADGLSVVGSAVTLVVGKSGTPVTVTGGGAANSAINDASTSTTKTYYTNITGGTATSAYGITVSGATGTVNITGNVAGSSGVSSSGVYRTGAATVTVGGNCTAGGNAAYGCYNNTNTANFTVNGDCIAGTHQLSYGCYGSGSAGFFMNVTGNIVDTSICSGKGGNVRWTPSSEAKYQKFFDSTGTAYYVGKAPDGNKVLPTDNYVKYDDGTWPAGIAPSGGGAWAF